MWFLYLLSWISTVILALLLTVAVASGLYYVAELVEEYTVTARKIIWWLCIISLGIYCGLFVFESFPLSMILFGIISQISHICILNTFPYFVVNSTSFIVSVVMLVINHYLAIQHFKEMTYIAFSELLAYFTLCLWMVPFSLFVSLSANENILPTVETRHDDDVVSSYFSKKGKKYGLLTFFNYAKESVLPQRTKKAF